MSSHRPVPDDAALLHPPLKPQQRLPAGPALPARRWRSGELLGQAQEIEIEHGQAVYRLRLTSLGKLILTK